MLLLYIKKSLVEGFNDRNDSITLCSINIQLKIKLKICKNKYTECKYQVKKKINSRCL